MHVSPSVYMEILINNTTPMRIWGKEMRKKILIGSMLVLAMLLLMPSIPAIQQKTVEDGIKQDLQEKLDTINLDDLKDIKDLEWIKHPILYFIATLKYILRHFRSAFNLFFALFAFAKLDYVDPFGFDIEITHPILFSIFMVRAFWFFVTGNAWLVFYGISDILGWGWEF